MSHTTRWLAVTPTQWTAISLMSRRRGEQWFLTHNAITQSARSSAQVALGPNLEFLALGGGLAQTV